MKDKNLLDDIESKSLDELNNLANKIIDNLEKKSLEDSVQEYQEMLKVNNYIQKMQIQSKLVQLKLKRELIFFQ